MVPAQLSVRQDKRDRTFARWQLGPDWPPFPQMHCQYRYEARRRKESKHISEFLLLPLLASVQAKTSQAQQTTVCRAALNTGPSTILFPWELCSRQFPDRWQPRDKHARPVERV